MALNNCQNFPNHDIPDQENKPRIPTVVLDRQTWYQSLNFM